MFGLNELEFTLLETLHADGACHPYGLARTIEERAGRRVVSIAGLYKALHRLDEKGCVASKWEEVDPKAVGRPRRRIYEISVHGERVRHDAEFERAAMRRTYAPGAM